MPADRGSDILCMLMPHNVGFVPLFSVYLLDSSPSPIAFVANGVCVPHFPFLELNGEIHFRGIISFEIEITEKGNYYLEAEVHRILFIQRRVRSCRRVNAR